MGMYELCSAHILEVADLLFSSPILEVSIYTCISDVLPLPVGVSQPELLRESTIIGMICLDGYSMAAGISFKSMFCFQCSAAFIEY